MASNKQEQYLFEGLIDEDSLYFEPSLLSKPAKKLHFSTILLEKK